MKDVIIHFGGCYKTGDTWRGAGDDGHVHYPDRICFRQESPSIGLILHEWAHLEYGKFDGHLGRWKEIYEGLLKKAVKALERELSI